MTLTPPFYPKTQLTPSPRQGKRQASPEMLHLLGEFFTPIRTTSRTLCREEVKDTEDPQSPVLDAPGRGFVFVADSATPPRESLQRGREHKGKTTTKARVGMLNVTEMVRK